MPVLQKLLRESNATLNQTVEVVQKMTLAPLLATPDFYTVKTISGQIKTGARLEAVAAVMQPSEPGEIVYFSAIFRRFLSSARQRPCRAVGAAAAGVTRVVSALAVEQAGLGRRQTLLLNVGSGPPSFRVKPFSASRQKKQSNMS